MRFLSLMIGIASAIPLLAGCIPQPPGPQLIPPAPPGSQPGGQQYLYRIINFPGASDTWINGINDTGEIVGRYRDSGGEHGFWGTVGHLVQYDAPGTDMHNGTTSINGVNNRGQIIGSYYTGPLSGTEHGFVDEPTLANAFAQINVQNANTTANGINGAGWIVGEYSNNPSKFHGFFYNCTAPRRCNVNYVPIDIPLASSTSAMAINNAGQVAGYFEDASHVRHGFVGPLGSFTTVDVPSVRDTVVRGINDAGQMVGTSRFPVRGFVDTQGSFTPIYFLGAISTEVFGINQRGQIVGYYDDTRGAHGFLGTPVFSAH